ncbi:MAG TPA: SDR family oxidoreductase [Candidatus Binatia bacterium]|jgi:short-subunit dehydrogenase
MPASAKDTVVITGAASGIGRALAREFHREGYSLALVDIDREGLDEITTSLPGATAHLGDVAREADVAAIRESVVRAHDTVHILVNNAGVSAAGLIEEMPIEALQRTMDVNFWGIVYCCRAFLVDLRAAAAQGQSAAICNVLSDFALLSLPTKAAYAASKHAARAFTEALGAELYGSGVSVTAVYPGATATAIVRSGFAVDPLKQQREADYLARGTAPEVVARHIVRAIRARRSRVLVGLDTRAIDIASRVAPGLLQFGVRRLWRRVPFL